MKKLLYFCSFLLLSNSEIFCAAINKTHFKPMYDAGIPREVQEIVYDYLKAEFKLSDKIKASCKPVKLSKHRIATIEDNKILICNLITKDVQIFVDPKEIFKQEGEVKHVDLLLLENGCLASIINNCKAILWDTETGKAVKILNLDIDKPSDELTGLECNNNLVILDNQSDNIRILSLLTGLTKHKIQTGHRGIGRTRIDKLNNFLIATCGLKEEIKIWDIEHGTLKHSLNHEIRTPVPDKHYDWGIFGVTPVMLDDHIMACAVPNSNIVKIWDIDTGKCIHSFEGANDGQDGSPKIRSLDLLAIERDLAWKIKKVKPGKSKLLIISALNSIKIWDLEIMDFVKEIELKNRNSHSCHLLQNNLLAVDNGSAFIDLWDINYDKPIEESIQVDDRVFEADEIEGQLYITTRTGIKILDHKANRIKYDGKAEKKFKKSKNQIGCCDKILELNEREILVVPYKSCEAIIYDLKEKLPPLAIRSQHKNPIVNLKLLPDNHFATISETEIHVFDYAQDLIKFIGSFNLKILLDRESILLKINQRALEVLKNEIIAFGFEQNGQIILWDYKQKSKVRGFDYTAKVTKILEQTSGLLMTSSLDHTIKVWDIATMQCKKTLNCAATPTAMVLVPNTNNVIVGYHDGAIVMWDYESDPTKFIEVLKFEESLGTIFPGDGLRILPNGKLVSISTDQNLKLWDINTGKCIQTIRLSFHAFNCLNVFRNKLYVGVVDKNNNPVGKVFEIKSDILVPAEGDYLDSEIEEDVKYEQDEEKSA